MSLLNAFGQLAFSVLPRLLTLLRLSPCYHYHFQLKPKLKGQNLGIFGLVLVVIGHVSILHYWFLLNK